jgi:hypothetical protein
MKTFLYSWREKIPPVPHLEDVLYKKYTRQSEDICKFCKYMYRVGCAFIIALNCVNYIKRVS